MHSNKYTFLYAAAVTAIVGASLAVAVSGLKPRQDQNVLFANRRAILQTVMEVDPRTLEQDYRRYIEERVFDRQGNVIPGVSATSLNLRDESRKPDAQQRLPLYVYRQNGTTRYIVPMRGNGLWGPIGAFLALESDLTSIYSVAFEHEKETPGLGAEIDTPMFEDRYKQKRIFREDGTLAPVAVLRGAGTDTRNLPHAVDGLTGATMTLNGVTSMFQAELARYARVFEKLRPSE